MVARFKKNKKRGSWKNIFFSIFLGIALILVISFLFYTNWKINQRRSQLTANIATLKEEIQILEQKNQELKEKMSEVGSEEHLEKVARDQLAMKAPGEEVVVVKKEEEKKEEVQKVQEEKKTWWEIIKSIWSR